MCRKYIGFDTSNYTTSAAAIDDNNRVQNIRKLLPVTKGNKGLRQSDAVFLHCRQMPEVYSQLNFDRNGINVVAVSSRPRTVDGSYMPCFISGVAFAEVTANTLGVPLYTYSHQQGHIAAALYSLNRLDLINKPFLAFHLSGGTMELLLVSGINDISVLSSSADITAGQLIDRTGVMLGLDFPCGKEIDKYASAGRGTCGIPNIVLKDGNVCLSGFENKLMRFMKDGYSSEDISLYVVSVAVSAAEAMLSHTFSAFPGTKGLPLVFSGGVSSNSLMRKYFEDKYSGMFASPSFSCDNAAGIAVLAKLAHDGIIFAERR